MRKIYKGLAMVALLLMTSVVAVAQTTAYAITSNANSKNCYVFSFDLSDPSTVNTIWTDTVAKEGAALATLADSIYYVYMANEGDAYEFCTINMAAGKKVSLTSVTPESNETWYDICYDATTEKLYGLRKTDTYDDEGSRIATEHQLCTIDSQTGKWTVYATLPEEIVNSSSASYYLGPICSDGKGGIYVIGANRWLNGSGMEAFWNSYVNLYRVDLTTKKTETVYENNEATLVKLSYSNIVGAGVKVSMEVLDGKLYIIANNNLLIMDTATGAVTKNEKKFSGEPVGLCFAMSTADGESDFIEGGVAAKPSLLLRVVETYGDHMGEREGVMTHKTVALLDGENKLQREVTYGYSYSNEWEIEYFKSYIYNEEGLLSKSFSEQYGIYDGTDLAFRDSEDTVSYEYDEQGNLVKEVSHVDNRMTLYQYDEEGRLVKEIKQYPDRYNRYEGDYYNMYEITYSAFNKWGTPDSVHSVGMYENYNYFCANTYDEQGRKVAAHTWASKDTADVKMEVWTYFDEGDTIEIHWEHEWQSGIDKGEKRTVYSMDNGDPCRIKEQVQYLTDGVWVNAPTYIVTVVSEVMHPEAAVTLAVTDGRLVDETLEPNSALLTISLFDVPVTGTVAFDVYRHGIFLARLNGSDVKDGKLTYIDEGVKNETYDYYVQTVFINELMETEEAFNISNVVTYKHDTELPVVTDIKCTGARLEGGVFYATIEWTAPADTAGLAFQRYNVMLERMKAADNHEADGKATKWEVNCSYSGKANLYIQSVYKYGKVNSEMISIDCKEVMEAQSIESAEVAAQVTVKDGIVVASASARMVAYNAQGAQVAVANTTLDLNNLPAGIYLVKVETAEGIQTVKVRM